MLHYRVTRVADLVFDKDIYFLDIIILLVASLRFKLCGTGILFI